MFLRLKWCWFLVLASAANAQPLPCHHPLILVESENPVLHSQVCEVALAVLPRLETCHLKQVRPVIFGFEAELLQSSEVCLGLYHKGEDRIDLLTPEAFQAAHLQSDFCTTIPIEEHFDSIVVHELTHALLDQSPCRETACRVDQEYIAYAMQMQSLPEPSREDFLASMGLNAPIQEERLNEFVLSISPARFAAAAWLHFSAPGNGCDFVGRIVRGEYTLWQEPF